MSNDTWNCIRISTDDSTRMIDVRDIARIHQNPQTITV